MRRLSLLVVAAACGSPSTPPAQPVPPAPTAEAPAPDLPAPVPAAAKPAVPAKVDAAAWLASCREPLAAAKAQQKLLLEVQGARTIENTLDSFNELSRFLGNAAAMAGLFQAVHPDAGVRDAARTCEQEVSTYISELLLDRKVYDAIAAVDVKKADPNTRRFSAITLREYKRAGVALDDKKRARIKQIDDELTVVGQDIQKNVAEDTRKIEVTDAKRLSGMPSDWISAHKPGAGGAIAITTDYPDYNPFMELADDDELRKQLYVQFRLRGADKNEPLIQRMLELRAERAKLLGFANWADYQSDDKMLRGGAAAAQFIDRVAALAKKRAARDYAELLAAKKKLDPKATEVFDWQKAYFEQKVKKDQYAVDSTEVRKYFVYDNVLAGLLDITSQIYDLQYKPVSDGGAWHPAVKVFDVMRGGDKLGRIYLDMHPRADKYKHAAQFTLKDGYEGKQLPEGALVCNFPDPRTSNGPALMTHDDVTTMFHEFGHLLHHVIGGHQKWGRQSGVTTELDFVEAPSQMFEEWGWSHDTLSRFAKHYQTGEVIPAKLVVDMRKADKFGLGTQTVQQMFYAALSLGFHRANPKNIDQLAMVKQMQKKYTPFAYVDGTKFHASFTHLVGYSSMYYTYMWSLVIAKDLLTPFEKSGLLNTEVTHRYRDKILAAGSTKDAADLVKDFLGRPYNFKAFEKYLSE
ncbi:MAG: M3 family metallopeptidase [Kofleriaceae bacterium]